AFNASFSVFVYLFLVKRKDKPMPNGGTIEPIILTASGPNTPSTNNPSENKDIVLFTGPPKSKLAMPPKIDPITKFELPFIDSSILISEFCNAEIGIPITVSINKPLITVEITGIIITGIKPSMLFGTFIYLLTANTMLPTNKPPIIQPIKPLYISLTIKPINIPNSTFVRTAMDNVINAETRRNTEEF